jgi:adenine-specific DNA-methyltransferase
MRFLPYLGNKRKLIPQILETIGSQERVLDLFSGSGVVAYHLRQQGSVVHANDIAPYSYHINKTYLEYEETPPNITDLNQADQPEVPYFSKYYSENPGASRERLFYTRENGIFIDAALERIWGDYPHRSVALCDLLYKMATHANTSGMFKSFHKKIAGNTRTTGVHKHVYACNKKRITTRIQLENPVLPKGPIGKAFQYEAEEFFDKTNECYDAIYIDPPYNTHQYSGNYHLLEQACRPVKTRYIPKDKQTSGIEPSLYKSPYCYKDRFLHTFASLFRKMRDRAKVVVVS